MAFTLEFITAKSSKGRSPSFSTKSNKKLKSKEPSSSSLQPMGASVSVVSSPTPSSFKHVAHIGFNQTSGVIETSKNLDLAFQDILAELRKQTGCEVTENVALEQLDSLQGFWNDVGTVQRNMSNRVVPAN
jgi:Wiskott-Aldrich syndrome protein